MTLSERIQYLVYWTVKYMYEIKLVPLVFQCIKVLSEVVILFWQKKKKGKVKKKRNKVPTDIVSNDQRSIGVVS